MTQDAHPVPELMRLGMFCKLFNVPKSNVYEMLSRGQIVAVKVGRGTYIRRSDAVRWMDELPRWTGKDEEVA